MIDIDDWETHPPTLPCLTDLAAAHGLSLPPGTHLIDDADWEILVDMKRERRMLLLSKVYGREKLAWCLTILEQEAANPGLIERFIADKRTASKRRIGALSTPSLIRKEMAALYRETYNAGPDDARHHTRMMCMLDCLARTAALEAKLPKHAEKAGQMARE